MLNTKDVSEIKKCVVEYDIQTIIFDLDGVLLETDHDEAEKQLSFTEKCSMATFTMHHLKKPTKKWLFETLTKICNNNSLFLFHDNIDEPSKYQAFNEGLKMPPVMCLWQAGIYSSVEALDITLKDVDDAYHNKLICKNDASVLKIIARLTYDIEKFTNTRKLSGVAEDLIELAQACNVQIGLITNYAVDQFERSFQKFGSILKAFPKENVIISAKEGLVKPDENIYKLILERCHFDPNKTLFVDDERHNVEGAIKAGIRFGYFPKVGLIK